MPVFLEDLVATLEPAVGFLQILGVLAALEQERRKGKIDGQVVRVLFQRAQNLLFGTEYTDVCFGYTAFWRRSLGQIATAPGFEVEASMCISAARAGLDVVELASFERKRVHGESKLHAVRDGLRILVTILGARVQRRADQEPVEAPASA